MQPFRVVDHVFAASLGHSAAGCFQLGQARHWRFVNKIVFPGGHHPQTKEAALAGDGGTGDKLNIRVGQQLVQAGRCPRLRKSAAVGGNFFRVFIPNSGQCCTGFQQAVCHAVDVAVFQPHGGKLKFPRADNGLRFRRQVQLHVTKTPSGRCRRRQRRHRCWDSGSRPHGWYCRPVPDLSVPQTLAGAVPRSRPHRPERGRRPEYA